MRAALACMAADYGNAGSWNHVYGARAKRIAEQARDAVAAAAGCGRGEVVFTSGATESCNLAILGLEAQGRATGRMHLVATAIEHRAVLEPLQHLASRGFELTLVPPGPSGAVAAEAIAEALRPDTLLVAVMQVNNETGVIQPVAEVAALLGEHAAYLLVDAAQGFAWRPEDLRFPRVDLVSISGHKLFAPKGVGALIARRRQGDRPPLQPLMHGGGQELGLRPGTLPVPLVAALGVAVEECLAERDRRVRACEGFRRRLLRELACLQPEFNGDPSLSAPHILNVSFPGLEGEDVVEAWRDLAAVSTGAACSTQSRTCSHVLEAMGIPEERAAGAVRLSWCHRTPRPDWRVMVDRLRSPA